MITQLVRFRRLVTSIYSLTTPYLHRWQISPKIASYGGTFSIPIRMKYQNISGVKGTKAKKFKTENVDQENEALTENNDDYDLEEDR